MHFELKNNQKLGYIRMVWIYFPGLLQCPYKREVRNERISREEKVGRSHHSRAEKGLGRFSIRTAWEAHEKSTWKDP